MSGARGACAATFFAIVGHALAQIPMEPPPNPVPELLRLLASDEREVRLAVVDRLGALRLTNNGYLRGQGPFTEDVSRRLLLLCEEDPDADVALSAGITLLAFGPLPDLVRAHLAARLPEWRRSGAAEAPVAALAEALAAALASGLAENDRRPAALVAPLAALAAGPVRSGALITLAMLGADAREVIPQLAAMLGQQPVSEHWRVGLALAGVGSSAGLSTALQDTDARLRVVAAVAHLRDAANTPPPNAAVVPWLADRRLIVRSMAIAAVPRLTDPSAATIRSVAELLEDERLRPAARQALQELGSRATAAVPVLIGFLAAESDALVEFAVGSLGAIGGGSAAAVEPLVALAVGPGDEMAHSYICGQALARIAPQQAVTLLMRAFERDLAGDRDARWGSALTLSAMGGAAAPELARFVAVLEGGSTQARANALHVLAAFGLQAMPALPAVLRQFDGTDSWVWSSAMEVVRAIGPAAAPLAIPKLEQRYGEVPSRRLDIVLRLHALGAAAEPLLLRGSADGDPMVRWHADEALLRLPDLSAAGAERLASLLSVADARDLSNGLQLGPWRHLVGPLEELAVVPPRLQERLPPLLDHPDFPVFATVAKILVRDLCPEAGRHHGWDKLLVVADRAAVKKALADREALMSWVRGMGESGDGEVRDASAALLPLLIR